MLRGTAQPIGQGNVSSYVMVDEQEQITEIGVVFSEAVLEDLPSETTEVDLSMPADISAPPFTHIAVNWNPHGHTPDPSFRDSPMGLIKPLFTGFLMACWSLLS